MTTTAVDPTQAAVAAAAAPSGLSPNQTIDKQQFLTLFLAQLKNQDPLSPLQPDQLTSQLAQFSSLEQLTGINTRLDTLTGTAKQTTTATLIALIGKQVRFDGGSVGVTKGVAPDVDYTLDKNVERVTATVIGPSGRVVRKLELGSGTVGPHSFHFDGHDGSGAVVPDGVYKIQLSAGGKDDSELKAVTLSATARVDGADLSGDTPALLVNGRRIGLDEVKEVLEEPKS